MKDQARERTVPEQAERVMDEETRVVSDIDLLCINAIRALSMDAVQEANSGHPGMPMGMADAAYVLWTRFLKHNPADPEWPDRDRFVLSAGHGSMLLYSLLHLTGYDLPVDELRRFRRLGSRTPGHPEHGHTPGVETTTGPLGQGFGNAVGLALAERYLAQRFNRPGYPIVDHFTYVICSDGDLMEGVSHEAASLTGHLGLAKLIYLYDNNRVTIDGSTELSFSDDTAGRFLAYGWHVERVDGHNAPEVDAALERARQETRRPSLIICSTHIGYGSPNRQDTAKAHGEALGAEEVVLTKRALQWPVEPTFYVPDAVYAHMRRAREVGERRQREWQEMFGRYRTAHPELAELWDRMWERRIPEDLDAILPYFEPSAKGIATRAASGQAINALAPVVPSLIGGSGDLAGSNNTLIKGAGPLEADSFEGRNIYFGVREHGMASALNGMALHGGLIPYGGTFLVFSDYMRPSVRLCALMGLHVIYVFTHDSIGLGEDGPTHQPIEHLAALRAIPNLYVVRPADAAETMVAWRIALERHEGPTALVLTRQSLPVLEREQHAPASEALRGAYVLRDVPDPDVLLLATGSEVQLVVEAATLLAERGISARVVSMPCWELFEQQDEKYREEVLPSSVPARVAVEAASPFGWERYVGSAGRIVGLDQFGASAPYQDLYRHFGLTPERIVEVAAELVATRA